MNHLAQDHACPDQLQWEAIRSLRGPPGVLAQRSAHLAAGQKVGGSSPPAPLLGLILVVLLRRPRVGHFHHGPRFRGGGACPGRLGRGPRSGGPVSDSRFDPMAKLPRLWATGPWGLCALFRRFRVRPLPQDKKDTLKSGELPVPRRNRLYISVES